MMLKILSLIAIITLAIGSAAAQDTSAYEIQRRKVNDLLAQRSEKFGQYDASLTARTGIFGFQTKRDIKNSNEILREIAITDNNIFQELKVLMNYKDLQVEQVRASASSASESILNYRKTIKDLQDQNQNLAKELKNAENKSSIAYLLLTLFLIGGSILAYLLNRKTKLLRRASNQIILTDSQNQKST